MELQEIKDGDEVLHIYDYEKKMEETKYILKSSWNRSLESQRPIERSDFVIKIDDPKLIKAKLDYQRYLCVKLLAFGSKKRFSDEILKKIDEINELMEKEDKDSTVKTLMACGAIQREPSFIISNIKSE